LRCPVGASNAYANVARGPGANVYARAKAERRRPVLSRRERLRRRFSEDPAYRERERARERRRRRKKTLETVYGISQEQYGGMLLHQGGLCAICKTKPDTTLCVDHSHATGQVRALLCNSCNSMLGFSNDDPRRLESGAVYLRAFRNEGP
jgi:Recombination endonuclease VII